MTKLDRVAFWLARRAWRRRQLRPRVRICLSVYSPGGVSALHMHDGLGVCL